MFIMLKIMNNKHLEKEQFGKINILFQRLQGCFRMSLINNKV